MTRALLKPAAWRRRLLRMMLLYVVTPYLAVMTIMAVFQRRLIFQPTKTDRLPAQQASSGGADIDDVELTVDNGVTLHGWRFHAAASADSKFLVIYFPGNAGCRENRLSDCRDFTPLGCDVLLFDYRGYGDNEGSPSEARLASDAQRIWKFAVNELHVPSYRILLFGESLGGGVAVRLAAELSQAGTPPAAVILNSTFASLADTAAWHYPFLPVRYLLWDRFPSADRMAQVACPVLQFHGTADDTVPFDHGRRLFAAAVPANSGVPHRFVTIEGGQHNFITVGMMQAEIAALLAQLDDARLNQ